MSYLTVLNVCISFFGRLPFYSRFRGGISIFLLFLSILCVVRSPMPSSWSALRSLAAGCAVVAAAGTATLAATASAGDALAAVPAGSVTHIAVPYVYKPDPSAPDASVPAEAEIDDSYERRARARRAQQILEEEMEDKFVTLYGVNVGTEARCVNSDPGDADWKNPLPAPFDPNTTDPIALSNEALRQVVRKVVKENRRKNNGQDMSVETKSGVKDVHDAAVIRPDDVVGMASAMAASREQSDPTYDELEGVNVGRDIEQQLVAKLKKEDEARKVEDAKQTQDQALIVEGA